MMFKYQKTVVKTALTGRSLLSCAQINKGTAFTREERKRFKLLGKLPNHVETLDEQVERAYFQFQTQSTRLRKNMYLHEVHETNRVLFYRLVETHLSEMLPLLYTPMVSTIVKIYSRKFRQPRGLYITYEDRHDIEEILANRTINDVDIIVATDGEGVLGIGDQGIGGMEIAVAKLMVYTLCGGVNPNKTLPLFLDVGTNNPDLLSDPMYLGWRHKRISASQYDELIDLFVNAVKKIFPHAFLHWEDLGRSNAARLLKRYKNTLPTFNDDIQGTGIVALSALLSALKRKGSTLNKEDIVIFGAGSAGTGIANQLFDALCFYHKLSPEAAKKHLWLIDRDGLLIEDNDNLTNEQKPFARSKADIAHLKSTDLANVVQNVKPGILIGCSGQSGAFNEAIIKTMLDSHKRPIIFPLSNPNSKAEAHPDDLKRWTNDQALIATGSPFENIAQCNNALVFPGIGLGIAATQATRLSKTMLFSACDALSKAGENADDILPNICDSKTIAQSIALAVAKTAIEEGLAPPTDNLESLIEHHLWQAEYPVLELID